tara:strand:+ start:413 stop:1012 length:600 start_codon:yes stop_codon:yes gene_type:complete
MNIKTIIQIFVFLIIIISLYFFIKETFLSENKEIIDLDIEKEKIITQEIDIKENNDGGDIVEKINYKSIDANGNEYTLNAEMGEITKDDKNIIILTNVTAELKLKNKSDIIIKSDFAKYNSSNFSTFFYQNVSGYFENKKIFSDNLDLLFKDNKAMMYNNINFLDSNIEGNADKIKLNLLTGDIIITMLDKQKIQLIKD